MSRVKRGPSPRRRHKRVLDQVEGFFGGRKNRYRQAMRVLWKSWQYAYAGRKLRKRDFRVLWIARINAAARANGTSYSRLIAGLKKCGFPCSAAKFPKALESVGDLPIGDVGFGPLHFDSRVHYGTTTVKAVKDYLRGKGLLIR